MDKITARIEKDLVSKRFEYLMRLPPGIRLQLKRIEDIVFELWKLDSVFTGQIRIDCLNSCLKSRLTLGHILKSEGKDLVKYEFPRALKRIVRSANRVKRGKVNSFETLKQLLSGKVA